MEQDPIMVPSTGHQAGPVVDAFVNLSHDEKVRHLKKAGLWNRLKPMPGAKRALKRPAKRPNR